MKAFLLYPIPDPEIPARMICSGWTIEITGWTDEEKQIAQVIEIDNFAIPEDRFGYDTVIYWYPNEQYWMVDYKERPKPPKTELEKVKEEAAQLRKEVNTLTIMLADLFGKQQIEEGI